MIIKLILLIASTASASIAADAFTQKLYTEVNYEVSSAGWFRDRKEVQRVLLTGTAWILDTGKEKVFVTAAHTMGFGPRGTPVQIGAYTIKGDTKATRLNSKTVVGTLAYEIREIGTLSSEDDILLLRAEEAALSDSRSFKLARKPLKTGETVKVLGYPSTSHEQPQECSVAAVYQKHFILNKSMDSGYSGGLVLNTSGDAVGLVTGTEHKQATAVFIPAEALRQITWMNATTNVFGNQQVSNEVIQ